MLVLKPKGRGNWTPLVMAIEGKRLGALLIRKGQLLTLGGVVYRIAEVMP